MDTTMTAIDHVTLEASDPAAAEAFYAAAFGIGERLAVRASETETAGFRGFTLSLIAAQPSTVDDLLGTAIAAGATVIKPARKSLWGYGGVVQAPDGAIWKVATSSKKEIGAPARQIDELVLLLGAADVRASKRFYVDRGLVIEKSFGGKYVQFEGPASGVKLALLTRAALAKDAGVPADGTGSRRLAISGGSRAVTDPDGFAWEAPAA